MAKRRTGARMMTTSFYLSEKSIDLIESMSVPNSPAHSKSAALEKVLQRYQEVTRRCWPDLSAPELELLVTALSGVDFNGFAVHTLPERLEDNPDAFEAAQELGVDLAGLLTKLRGMGFGERLAIAHYIERTDMEALRE